MSNNKVPPSSEKFFCLHFFLTNKINKKKTTCSWSVGFHVLASRSSSRRLNCISNGWHVKSGFFSSRQFFVLHLITKMLRLPVSSLCKVVSTRATFRHLATYYLSCQTQIPKRTRTLQCFDELIPSKWTLLFTLNIWFDSIYSSIKDAIPIVQCQ